MSRVKTGHLGSLSVGACFSKLTFGGKISGVLANHSCSTSLVLAISLAPTSVFILGSLSSQKPPSIDEFLVIRSLHSVRNWHVCHVIDRNRCGLCHLVVRQLLVVFCPLALRARPGPEHLEWSFWHCVAFSRVSTLQVISSSLC